MKVKIKLSEILGRKRMSQLQLSKATGIRYPTISALYHEKAKRIEFSHLLKLCEVLDCTPGDLFEIIDDNEEENDGKADS
jgi:putative transcriptional regulator